MDLIEVIIKCKLELTHIDAHVCKLIYVVVILLPDEIVLVGLRFIRSST